MENVTEKMEQNDNREKVDQSTMDTSSANNQEECLLQDDNNSSNILNKDGSLVKEALSNESPKHVLNKDKDDVNENKTDSERQDMNTSHCSSNDQNPSDSTESQGKSKDLLCDSVYRPSDSDDSQDCETKKEADFKNVGFNFKNRNYRSQENAAENDDELDEQEKLERRENEDSSSSDSSSSSDVEFQNDAAERQDDSSDYGSEIADAINHADSNEWTTASDDDTDEMPEVLQKEPTKSNWSIVKDICNRQIGSNYFVPQRFYSSLHVVQRLELMSKLEKHCGCINALGFNQKGNLLASASDDLNISVWDWSIRKLNTFLRTGHRSNVFQSKFLPLDIESFIVTSARDGQVRLIDINTQVTRKIAQHKAACHKITTHLDLPHIILSAGEDSKVLLTDIRESAATRLLSVKDNDQDVELYSIDSNPLNNFEFCVAGRMRNVLIYDRRVPTIPLHQMYPKHLLKDEYTHVTCAVYNHNGTEVVATYNNEDIYLFDVATSYQSGDFAHKYQGHRNSATVKGVNFFGPKSEFVISGSDCGNIFIWDKKTEAIVQWMAGDEQGIVNALEPHPHIPILATGGLDYDVKIWIPSREKTPDIKRQLQSCVNKNLAAKSKHSGETENAFGHVLWIMLRHMNEQNPFARRLRVMTDGSSDSDEDIEDSDDDGDGGGETGEFSDNEDD